MTGAWQMTIPKTRGGEIKPMRKALLTFIMTIFCFTGVELASAQAADPQSDQTKQVQPVPDKTANNSTDQCASQTVQASQSATETNSEDFENQPEYGGGG